MIQSKIKYQPIDITFHDDNASQVTAMWDAYYRYNYADAWNPVVDPWSTAGSKTAKKLPGQFNRRNIYDPSISGDTEYGYRGDARGTGEGNEVGEKVPFFNNITVYGLWAGTYIAYTLINPIITSFDHDSYDYADGGGTMQNRMTIDYETVIYNTGIIDEETPPGFIDAPNYDKRQSPLEQGGNSPSDVLDRIKNFGDDGIIDGIRDGAKILDGIKSGSIEASIKKQVRSGLKDAVLGAIGLGGEANFPTNASSPAFVNIANQGVVTDANNSTVAPASTDPKTAGEQVKGFISNVLGI